MLLVYDSSLVMDESLLMQITVVSIIALIATVGVYGVVALIVRMDDVGLYLIARARHIKGALGRAFSWLGNFLVVSLPKLIRGLSIVGTIAMLLVGGGMFTHNIPALHHILADTPSLLADLLVGVIVGSVLLSFQLLVTKVRMDQR